MAWRARVTLAVLAILVGWGWRHLARHAGPPRHRPVVTAHAPERLRRPPAVAEELHPDPWRRRARAELAALPAPPSPGRGHPVDDLLAAYWARQRVPPPGRCDDATFVRRACLDLTGLPPDEHAAAAFAADPAPDKDRRLVARLLADDRAYAEHWISFWNDLLCNDEVSYILVTRQPFTAWLYQALAENRPFDRLVAELLDPPPGGPEGFVRGVDWAFSGTVSEVAPMRAARATAQAFLGVNLKCASCHDHFTHSWKLADSWGLAGFFTAENLRPHRCDRPAGKPVPPRFLFPELGGVAPDSGREERLRALARLVTAPANPRFARVVVNRLFGRLFGRALIEPTDDLDGRTAFAPELLDWLAYDLMAHDYDLRRTLALLATSAAYRARSTDAGREAPADEPPPFPGPRPRRLSSEQFQDALACLTGHWPKPKAVAVPGPGGRVRA